MPDAAAFDTLGAAETMTDAGIEEPHAKAIVGVVRDGRAGLATKADLDNLEARLETRIEKAINSLTWRMFAIGGLIVAAVKLL